MTIQELENLFKRWGHPTAKELAEHRGTNPNNAGRDLGRALAYLREFDAALAHMGYRISIDQDGDLDILICPSCGYANRTDEPEHEGCGCIECGACLAPEICEEHYSGK